MANMKGVATSLFMTLVTALLLFSYTADAAKGPKITHKVGSGKPVSTPSYDNHTKYLYRCSSTLSMVTRLWDELSWVSMERPCPRSVPKRLRW